MILSPDLASTQKVPLREHVLVQARGRLRGEPRVLVAVTYQPCKRSLGDICLRKPFQMSPGAAAISERSCTPLMSSECRNNACDRIDRSTSLLAYWPPSSQEPTTAICAEPPNLKVGANSLCPFPHPARLPPRFCMKTKGPWAQGSIPLHSSVSKHIKKREISAEAK